MDLQRRREWKSDGSWEVPYAAIQKKIGEELRKSIEPPQDLPHSLLTLLMQIADQEKSD
jgi:hypothetical protein